MKMERYGEGKPINIIYASNDGYACHLGASLYSLLDNNRSIPRLEIYVLSVGMSRRFENRLKAIGARFGRQVHMAEMGELRKRFPYEVDTRGFDISAMARLFAPEVLPASVDRALYLDCDTIVRGGIRGLYQTDLKGNLAGMVMEPTVYEKMRESIGLKRDDPYFNSGVILMDLEAWRREGTLKVLLDFYRERGGNLFACDQDTLNGALRGRILSLPPKYNFFTNYRYYRYPTLAGQCRAYGQVGETAFREARKNPVIIHFLGDERPWIAGSRNHYKKLYLGYLARTPWKGMPLVKGKWLYMQAWWALNQITRLCPAFRFFISRHLGMRVIDGRKKAGGGNG